MGTDLPGITPLRYKNVFTAQMKLTHASTQIIHR
jgi:hypothetical protein